MFRLLYTLLIVCVGSQIASHPAAAMPHRALIEAAGFRVAEPVAAAPAFTLNDHQGKPMAIQNQRGKVILINFWATWCPPCIHEMPLMNQLLSSMKARPFAIWALNVQETQEDVAKFLQSRNFHFPVLLDVDGKAMGGYQARGLPSTYLIDCAGNLIGAITGILKWTDSAMQTLLAALFKDAACQAKTAAYERLRHHLVSLPSNHLDSGR
jgi:peroxiredoxin